MLLQDSVILLDTMSSEEDTIEDSDVTEEMEAKERTDRLMSMAEYRDEIYEYLRKTEVYFFCCKYCSVSVLCLSNI